MKKHFDKKRKNLQELKIGDNVWLKAKNIHSKQSSKKLDHKRYKPFRISEDIGQGTFQIELLEGWMIHNVFNKNLLTQCRELYFKRQHMNLVPLLEIINKEKE